MNARRARLAGYLKAGRYAARRYSRADLLNAGRFAATHPRGALIMARKGVTRAIESSRGHDQADSLAWLAARAQDPAALAREIAPDLWQEAIEFSDRLHARAKEILRSIPYSLHSGADDRFLYWLTRVHQPDVIVETGVCAGWASQAFLAALRQNGHGELHSSDLPLFYVRDPDSIVGCLVEDDLRADWHLHLDGDEVSLPRILADVPKVDLFHYDSDKSYSGRTFGMSLVQPKLAADGVVIMDDVRDNTWFYDTARESAQEATVLGEQGRFYGLIGEIDRA